jgi:hypothetical protein
MPPGTWNPAPAQSSGMSGCLKTFLVLAIIAVVGFTLLIAALVFIGSQIAESVGVDSEGSVGTPCAFVDNATLGEVLGSGAEAIKLEGLWDATIGIIADKRVLPDAEDCWITADNSTALGRIAEYKAGDAAAVYQRERQNAQPTSQDQGGGISLENPGYFGGDLSGLGDEAFCTGIDMALQTGVLVRRGDTLLYVSLTGAPDAIPSLGITDPGVVTADAVCATAQEIARRILR